MRAETIAFTGHLVHRFPRVMPLLQEHMDDFDGVLPHLFMSELVRWMSGEALDEHNLEYLQQMMSFIEQSFSVASAAERELVIASFLENLPYRSEPGGSQLRGMLGPQLSAALELTPNS